MSRKHNDLDAGFHAFQDALKPQEGKFMRGATFIINDPKDLSDKPSRNPSTVKATDNERIASALQERNALGHFIKRGD